MKPLILLSIFVLSFALTGHAMIVHDDQLDVVPIVATTMTPLSPTQAHVEIEDDLTSFANYLRSIFGGELVKVEVELGNNTITACVEVTDPPKVTAPPCNNYTIWVKAKESAIQALQVSTDKKSTFIAERAKGNISYGSDDFLIGIRILFVNMFIGLFG